MQLAWLTDIHLDFVDDAERQQLVQDVIATKADAVLIGGDIAVANTFVDELIQLQSGIQRPVYYVLGNHDYFGRSIADVREQARQLSLSSDGQILWLSGTEAMLCGETAVIGHGGWGDGRSGEFFESTIALNDYMMIAELQAEFDPQRHKGKLPHSLFKALNELGDEAASRLGELLPSALQLADHVLLVMHVPPFREACWYNGRLSDDNWAPHFVCQAAGEYLAAEMSQHPTKRLTVLCGHTHGEGTTDILPNLHVITGGAKYGKPAVQRVFDV